MFAAPPVPPSGIEPDPRTRHLIALLLRAGLGMNLLNSGLLSYLGSRSGFGALAGLPTVMPIDPITQGLALIQIVIGLALVLGLFTTIAALVSGLIVLFAPMGQMLLLLTGGFGGSPFANPRYGLPDMSLTGTTNQLLLVAAILWLSSPESNPWSLDRLFFAPRRRPVEPPAPPPVADEKTPAPESEPAPRPGERTAQFIARREE